MSLPPLLMLLLPLQLRDASVPETSASLCYEPADATHFKVRAVDYATSRLKVSTLL